jgi:hypothetical protein
MIVIPIADQDFGEPVDLLHHAFELTYSGPSTEMPTNVRGSVPSSYRWAQRTLQCCGRG